MFIGFVLLVDRIPGSLFCLRCVLGVVKYGVIAFDKCFLGVFGEVRSYLGRQIGGAIATTGAGAG